jgi:hypothetical protein
MNKKKTRLHCEAWSVILMIVITVVMVITGAAAIFQA